MQELLAQIIVVNSRKLLKPYTIEDEEALDDFKPMQIVKVKMQGSRMARSYQQLRLWFGACAFLSENTDDQNWNTKDKVHHQVMLSLGEIDHKKTIVAPDGSVYFHIRSVSFKNMKHLEACNVFNRGYEVMAAKLGVAKPKGKNPDGTPKTAGEVFVDMVIEWLKERG